jgi:hypothetical protein
MLKTVGLIVGLCIVLTGVGFALGAMGVYFFHGSCPLLITPIVLASSGIVFYVRYVVVETYLCGVDVAKSDSMASVENRLFAYSLFGMTAVFLMLYFGWMCKYFYPMTWLFDLWRSPTALAIFFVSLVSWLVPLCTALLMLAAPPQSYERDAFTR